MDEKFKKRLTKDQILTIPNMLSFFRILLIPVIIVLYCTFNLHYYAAGVVVLSGITDVLDGFIARRFNMVTDFGKFIDPVADKLTQAALIYCAATVNWWVLFLLGVMVIKELSIFLAGLFFFKRHEKVNSAQWYGKVCTVLIYSSMLSLFIYPQMPITVVAILFSVCLTAVLMSGILYGIFFFRLLRPKNKQNIE